MSRRLFDSMPIRLLACALLLAPTAAAQTEAASPTMNFNACYDILPMAGARRDGGSRSQHQPQLNGSGCDPLNLELAAARGFIGQALQPDATQLFSLGVDPATLAPQGLDLDIFPSFPASEELSLRPALSYGPDAWLTRAGLLRYAPPKRWRAHYGELVRLVGRLDGRKHPIGRLLNPSPDPNAAYDGPREAVPAEVQTYFLNAAGQEVNFYPDPDQFGVADPGGEPDTPNPGDYLEPGRTAVSRWHSEDGRYRLDDVSTDPDAYLFKLLTPNGLAFEFERYDERIDADREILSLHWRVVKITDRLGHFIAVSYDDQPEPSLRTDAARSHRADGTLFQEIDYVYEAGGDRRLTQIRVPRYGGGQGVFEFYYPDQAGLWTESRAGEVALKGSTAELTPLHAGTLPARISQPAGAGAEAYEIELDLAGLPLLHVALDYDRLETEPGASFILRLTDAAGQTGVYRLDPANPNQLNAPEGFNASPAVYRYQRFAPLSDKPDLLRVERVGGTAILSESCQAVVYPLVKRGDRIVNAAGAAATLDIDWNRRDFDPTAVALGVNLGGSAANPAQGYHLREDNIDRVAEIRFPEEGGASQGRKRLVIGYDDLSLNHQEIAQAAHYHGADLISRTEYRYERVRTLAASDDLFAFFAEPDNPFGVPGQAYARQGACAIDWSAGADPIEPGLPRSREQELDLLRQKDVVFDEDPLTAGFQAKTLTTRYGGAYRVVAAGAPGPAYPGSPEGFCGFVQWGLDGKPFDFTWEIAPDGTAAVFDLNPDGLDLDPAIADYQRRRRAFKTYRFDRFFGPALAAGYPRLYDAGAPFHRFLPYYASANPRPSQPQTPGGEYAVPKLEGVFGWRSGAGGAPVAKCFEAEIAVFEPVPLYKYRLSAGPANPYEYLRREPIQALYGQLQRVTGGEGVAGKRYSAIQELGANPGNLGAEAERWLKGRRTDAVNPFPAGLGSAVTVAWRVGGRLDLGAVYAEYFDRQKLHRLRPHFRYRLMNLAGFEWTDPDPTDDKPGYLDVQAKHFREGTRFSNGGWLGTGPAGVYRSGAGATDRLEATGWLRLASGTAALAGALRPDDSFRHDNRTYSVVAVDPPGAPGNPSALHKITFTPGLRGELEVGEPLSFYRRYNPAWTAAGPRIDNGYHGHDAFGSNGYRETYVHGNPGLAWRTEPHARLAPDFANAEPDRLEWNDSTAWANQDVANWRYFGRVGKTYSGDARPVFAYDDPGEPIAPVSGPGYKRAALTEHDAVFPWKPRMTTDYYRLQTGEPFPPAEHAEDRITVFAYETASGLGGGKLRLQLEYKRQGLDDGTLADFSALWRMYDANGRVARERTAAFLDGASPYGFEVLYTRDANTGLPTEERTRVFDPGMDSFAPLSAATLQSNAPRDQTRVRAQYDYLGRPVETRTEDRNGGRMGPAVHTQYPGPLLTETRETLGDVDAAQLARTIERRNGLGQPTRTETQQGVTEPVYVARWEYDDAARLVKSHAAKRDGAAAGWTQTAYHPRGEAWGQVRCDDAGQAQSSVWTPRDQDPADGALRVYQVSRGLASVDHAETPSLTVKRQTLDGHGNPVEVADHRVGASTAAPYTEAQLRFLDDGLPAAELTGLWSALANLSAADRLSRAVYQYDRFDNVFQAEAGSAAIQTRELRYDPGNRLRYERHPEIDNPVRYGDFDHFDNPRRMAYGDLAGGPRGLTAAYDAYGAPLTLSHSGEHPVTMTYQYNWQTQTSSRFPDLRVFAKADYGQRVFGERRVYDGLTGWLTRLDALHNAEANLPGYTAAVAFTAPVDPDASLTLSYDAARVGRIGRAGYPAALRAGAAGEGLALDHDYFGVDPISQGDVEAGVLKAVRFELAGRAHGLILDAGYGPDGGADSHRLIRRDQGAARYRDALNRVAALRFEPAAMTGHAREYGYDAHERIAAIHTGEAGAALDPAYAYGYDALGQIATADIAEAGAADAFRFRYDGFGNLTQRRSGAAIAVDGTANRLAGGFVYNRFGELTDGPREGQTFRADYWASGRMRSYTLGPAANPEEDLEYFYNADGLRVLVEDRERGRKTLYCYDEGGRILSERVAEGGGPAGLQNAFVHFDGKTALSFRDADPAASPGTAPAPVQPGAPLFLEEPLFTWPDQDGPVRLTLLDDRGATALEHHGLVGGAYQSAWPLPYGRYGLRVGPADGALGPARTLYYMTSADRDRAGEYPFDGDVVDRSHYRNHGVNLGAGFAPGRLAEGCLFDGSGEVLIPQPFQHQASGARGSILVWLKSDAIEAGGEEGGPPEAWRLLEYGALQLDLVSSGLLQLRWQAGQTPQQASLAVANGQWRSLALIFGQGSIQLYVDKVLALNASGAPAAFPSADLRLGRGSTGLGFRGVLDGLKLYNREATSAEISAAFETAAGSGGGQE